MMLRGGEGGREGTEYTAECGLRGGGGFGVGFPGLLAYFRSLSASDPCLRTIGAVQGLLSSWCSVCCHRPS